MASDHDKVGTDPTLPSAPGLSPAGGSTQAGVGPGGGSSSDDMASAPTAAASTAEQTYESFDPLATPVSDVTPITPSDSGAMYTPGGGPLRDSAELAGVVLADRYRILERLGSGGMAHVYKARHELLNKTVAVKVLKNTLAADRVSLTRFHREAKAAASIGDSHIVDITDYGFTPQGEAFIVMEHLEGDSLRAVVRDEGALQSGRCVSIARQILRGLAAAHEEGIIHRDLKSDNVFLVPQGDRDFVKLLDFGISKVTRAGEEGEPSLTSTGVVMGTPQYLAPEQAHGMENVDLRADIYALGVMLYEMLTGQLPFSGRSNFEIVMKHIQEDPLPPRRCRPELNIPAELEKIVLRAMAKEPGRRYATAEAMLAALPDGKALPGGYTSEVIDRVAPVPPGKTRVVPVVVAVLAVLVAGVLFLVLSDEPEINKNDKLPAVSPPPVTIPDARPPRPDKALPDVTPDLTAAVQTVILDIVTRPANARIFHGDLALGTGRVRLEVPRGTDKLRYRATAPRHVTKEVEVLPDRAREVTIELLRRKVKVPVRDKKPPTSGIENLDKVKKDRFNNP